MPDATHEEWHPVVGYEGLYEVSSLGRIRSLRRMTRCGPRGGRLLKTPLGSHGYPVVGLWANGSGSVKTVHSLVAAAFLGECPEGLEIRHRDGNKANATRANLMYGTHSENEHDKVQHGTNHNAAKDCCDSGHEFTPGNTYIRPGGGRDCETCRRDRGRKYMRRKRRETPV